MKKKVVYWFLALLILAFVGWWSLQDLCYSPQEKQKLLKEYKTSKRHQIGKIVIKTQIANKGRPFPEVEELMRFRSVVRLTVLSLVWFPFWLTFFALKHWWVERNERA